MNTKVTDAFEEFTGPDKLPALSATLKNLLSYLRFTKYAGFFETEHKRILRKAKEIVTRQIWVVLNRDAWSAQDMPAADWVRVYGSMLAVSSSRHFYERFGMEMILLMQSQWEVSGVAGIVNMGEYQFKNGELKCKDSTKHKVKVPAHPQDPNHFGHLIWMFCSISEKIAAWKQELGV